MKMMITEKEEISKFLLDHEMDYFTSVAKKHISEIMCATMKEGFTGKTAQMTAYSENHRTTMSHFLSKGKWDDKKLCQTIQYKTYKYILKQAMTEETPIFVSIDDTTNPKKKPHSNAKHGIEGGSYHYSHLLGKTVWGHQVQATIVSTGKTALCYELNRYDKETTNKIQIAISTAQSLPIVQKNGYALMDSWYTCPKVVNAFSAKGYHTIAALKTNRIIYPLGVGLSISEFATTCIQKSDANLVTVGRKRYYIYRYEGSLNGIENAVVLISYPEEAFGEAPALRAFLCTDTNLDTTTILEYYHHRWKIEVFFKQQKSLLGFSGYQMRSIKGIVRFWTLLSLTHFYCVAKSNIPLPFGDSVRLSRENISKSIALFFYEAGRDNVPFDTIYQKSSC